MLDERGLKSLRGFAAVMLVAISVVTVTLAAKYLGYNIGFLEGVMIEDTTRFFSFTLIIVSLGGIFNTPRKLSDDKKVIVRQKIRPLMIGNVIFIAYVLFSVFVIKNIYFILSSLIMEGVYINLILISRGLYSYALSDRQRQWREAMNGTSYSIQESSVLWRYKLWFRPLQWVPFKRRYLRSYNILIFVIGFGFILTQTMDDLFDLIIIFLYIKSAIAIFEYFLGIYTTITGVCTGVKIFEEDLDRNNRSTGSIRISFRSRRRYYWKVYITDFKNKREIVYKTYKMPFISDGDEVKVVHGVFSKAVISVNGFKLDDDPWTM